jgi:serine/threonine protein kinase
MTRYECFILSELEHFNDGLNECLQEELFDLILSGVFEFPTPFWDPVSDQARELVASMLQPDHSLRFSAEDVLDHPWLSVSTIYNLCCLHCSEIVMLCEH